MKTAWIGLGLWMFLWTLVACSGTQGGFDASMDGADGTTDADETHLPDGGEAAESDKSDGGLVTLSVTKVLPRRGPIAGGTWANVLGSGFVNGIGESPFDVRDVTSVFFGANPAIDIEVIRDDMISVRTPPGLAGPVTVKVQNPNGTAELADAFTFFETVSAYQIHPVDLRQSGGTSFVVDGTGFTVDTQVLIGKRPATGLSVLDSKQLQGVAPPGATGLADLDVINTNGGASLFHAVRFHPSAVLTSVNPAAGPDSGGTSVVLWGSGFEDGLSVLFGATPSGAVSFSTDETLKATTPPNPSSSVDVAVVGPADESRLTGGFIYFGQPSGQLKISGVAPASGPSHGGQTVTVVGEQFGSGGWQVLFNDQPATDIRILDDRQMRVRVPEGQIGKASVTIIGNQAQATLEGAYTYYQPLQVMSVTPAHGPAIGGTPFTIRGSGFEQGLLVRFGGIAAADARFISSSEIQGTTPPGSPGPVEVFLKDSFSQVVSSESFLYTSELVLWRVEPETGAIAGGTYVIVYGSGFTSQTQIKFNDQDAAIMQLVSPSMILARTPRGEPGEVTVAAIDEGERATLEGGYAYFNPTNDRGGASGGPIRGSVNLTALEGGWAKYGQGVEGATVVIADPAMQGNTDDRGQVTFSGPAVVHPMTITIGKQGYQATTVVSLNATNLTAYLFPNEQAPYIPPDDNNGNQNPGQVTTSTLSGRVFGFKDVPGLPTGPTVSLQARVNYTSWSIYSVPPFGGVPQGTIIDRDGGSFEYTARFGTYSLYAMFGALDSSDGTFTPALLGLRRAIQVSSEESVTDQDIVLSTYLDQTVPVNLINPPVAPADHQAQYSVYASLDLGRDGVIYCSKASGTGSPLQLGGLPAAASNSFLFVGLASLDGGYPYSYIFRRQDGGLEGGLNLGPFLDFLLIEQPAKDGELSNGRIAWSPLQDPKPALIQIMIETNDLMPKTLWRVVLPGDATEIVLPPEVLDWLPHGESLILLVYTANSPRFDFDSFNYSQLSSGRWTSYTVNFSTFTIP